MENNGTYRWTPGGSQNNKTPDMKKLGKKLVIGVVLVALLVAFLLLRKYFAECIKIYQVLIDHKDSSFNHTFKIAWFLHFYT